MGHCGLYFLHGFYFHNFLQVYHFHNWKKTMMKVKVNKKTLERPLKSLEDADV